EPAGELPGPQADGGLGGVEEGVRGGAAALAGAVPADTLDAHPVIDREQVVGRAALVPLAPAGLRVGRRGGKRLPPPRPASARPSRRPAAGSPRTGRGPAPHCPR